MVFQRFGKPTAKLQIPPNYSLIPPRWIGITLELGISWISPIPPKVIPIETFVNKTLILHIFRAVNQSVTNVAKPRLESCPHWG